MQAMNGQYLCNRQITVSYAYKKDTKGERHGTPAGMFYHHIVIHSSIKLFLELVNLHVTKETKSMLLMKHGCWLTP